MCICEFANINKEVKTQIIVGCLSQRLRRKALRDNPNLKVLLTYARAQEGSEAQATAVGKGVSSINAVKNEQRDTKISETHGKDQQSRFKHSSNIGNHKTTRLSTQQCRNCSRICGKCCHFAKVCKSKPKRQEIRQVVQTSTEEEPHTPLPRI